MSDASKLSNVSYDHNRNVADRETTGLRGVCVSFLSAHVSMINVFFFLKLQFRLSFLPNYDSVFAKGIYF
jgi:hypothetical protein